MRRKVLALALAVIMLLTGVGVPALASEIKESASGFFYIEETPTRFDPPFWENICLVFQLSHGCPLFRTPSLLV